MNKRRKPAKRKPRRKKLLVALEPYTILVPPKPQTVEEAWDAMKAAKQLPRRYRVAEPIAEPDECELQKVIEPDLSEDIALSGSEQTLRYREAVKRTCKHCRTNSDGSYTDKLNIKWHEHSNNIIMGVCGTCFSPFDTRDPEDFKFFLADPRAAQNMGRAGAHTITKQPPLVLAPLVLAPIELTWWQKFVAWLKQTFLQY